MIRSFKKTYANPNVTIGYAALIAAISPPYNPSVSNALAKGIQAFPSAKNIIGMAANLIPENV